MSGPNDGVGGEIVIVRRRGAGDEAGGKGGVWKIAYADFMTAMMAFFLVMWLINAANEATKAQVASYFNPIKLTDSAASKKGISENNTKPNAENNEGKQAEPGPEETESKDSKSSGESKDRHFSEEELFKDPYVVLAELAGKAAMGSPAGEARSGMASEVAGRSGLDGGIAFRDPFDPLKWKDLPEAPPEPPKSEGEKAAESKEAEAAAEKKGQAEKGEEAGAKSDTKEGEAEGPGGAKPMVEMKEAPSEQPAEKKETAEAKEKQAEAAEGEKQGAGKEANAGDGEKEGVGKETNKGDGEKEGAGAEEKPAEANAAAKSEPADIDQSEAIAVKNEILKQLGDTQLAETPAIDVVKTKEGVLISLTDTLDFGMFAIASAEPKPELVVTMDKIAKVLMDKEGRIVVRGHTDGRPYKGEAYDNWRLSTARAHMAYYMLIRAGIDQKKVERIEGHADHELKVPNDPFAAQNRRIEIMLRAADD